jgi:hypothetical protein
MKKNIIILLGSISFATLFHDKGLGLNCLLYALFLIGVLAFCNAKLFQKKAVIISIIAMIATATAILIHGSTLSITCYFLSVLSFIGYVASEQSSLYIAWMNGVYSVILGSFHRIIYNKPAPKNTNTLKIETGQLIKLIFIPLGLMSLFIILYSQTNPVFENWLNQLDFSFINLGWLFVAASGGLLISNVATPQIIEHTTIQDLETPDQLTSRVMDEPAALRAKNEVQIGSISLIGLNVLLVLVLISEFLFITDLSHLDASILSDAVHSGVYASIASIILAVIIIVFIFRGDVNFIKENKSLQLWSYVWITLNSFLILSILYKNYLYMGNYGLSIKRLGVLVYLFLCVIGLLTTYLKISRTYNLTYLFRKNTVLGFGIVLIYSCFNWAAVVTRYNIENDFIHVEQLERLLPQNILVLQELGKYEDVIIKTNERYFIKWNEYDFRNRNWQDFNYIAYKMKPSATVIPKNYKESTTGRLVPGPSPGYSNQN